MRSALYFPHTEVQSKSVVHASLLLWDTLEYIAPNDPYQPEYADPEIAEAMKLIGRPRIATVDEQKKVHSLIEELLQTGVPETFRYSPKSGDRDQAYEIWPQKLLPDTWQLLRSKGLTDDPLGNHDYPMSQAAGLSVMAILADVLAGQTRTRITDRGLAYATIANATEATSHAEDATRVVPLTFKGIAVDRLPMEKLIAFRMREDKENGSDYRNLRHTYLKAIEDHLETISKVAPNSVDRNELDRAFQSDMEDDLADLKKELGFAKRDAWLAKDIVALVIAGGALLAAAGASEFHMPEVLTGAGSAVLLGGFLNTGNKLAKARYDVLRKHSMAYLYELNG